MKSAVDNDVIYKGALYGILRDLLSAIPSSPDEIAILGAAKFVIGKRLEKQAKQGIAGADEALTQMRDLVESVAAIEPSPEEESLAAEFEHAAQLRSVPLDGGESLLCAIVLTRGIERLVTGDKRAIGALATLLNDESRLAGLAGKVLCIEQLVGRLLVTEAAETVRTAICCKGHVDRALTICFGCKNPASVVGDWISGLESYVNALRKEAPDFLATT